MTLARSPSHVVIGFANGQPQGTMLKKLKEAFSTFKARRRQQQFEERINFEIHNRIMSHVMRDEIFDYPFGSRSELREFGDKIDAQELHDLVEERIRNMPDGVGECFKYVFRRDLCQWLEQYAELAWKHRTRPEPDPRTVARPYVPA